MRTQDTNVQIHSELTTAQRIDKTYTVCVIMCQSAELKLAEVTQTTGISISFTLSIMS